MTLALAERFPGVPVTAVEEVPHAEKLMRRNLDQNRISHVESLCCSAEDFMDAHSLASFNSVVLDPPRGGCSARVLGEITSALPESIVYISCNPATLGRDVNFIMKTERYEVAAIRAFDLFPQTAHVETVLTLRRKGV
jgi:23S rRNA (uracil1939-C5)-methyltransferase